MSDFTPQPFGLSLSKANCNVSAALRQAQRERMFAREAGNV